MATPQKTLQLWVGALDSYARALCEYAEVVGDVAQKTRPAIRRRYTEFRKKANECLAQLQTIVDSFEKLQNVAGEALASAAFAILKKLGKTRKLLDASAAEILRPELLEAATREMSRTFIDSAEQKAKALRAERELVAASAKTRAAELTLWWADGIAQGDPVKVAAAYKTQPSTFAANLYAAALLRWKRDKTEPAVVAKLVEAAKDESLNVAIDSPEAIASDIKNRSALHPLQAMGLTFGLKATNQPADPKTASLVIDATLPQAKTDIRYNLDVLVDVRTATKFGKLANIFSGLNYRLIQRLRTIEEIPIQRSQKDDQPSIIRRPSGRDFVIARTTNGGGNFFRILCCSDLPKDAFLSVGAGPKPRVARLGEMFESAIFASSKRTVVADPERLILDYDARADDSTPMISTAELQQILVKGFAAEYDRKPPRSSSDFRTLVLGQRNPREPYRSFIARAVSTVAGRSIREKTLRREATGATKLAELFGSRGAAVLGEQQETHLTSIVQMGGSIEATRTQLSRAYVRINAKSRAEQIFKHSQSQVENEKSLASLRLALLELFRQVAKDAFLSGREHSAKYKTKAIEKLVVVEPRLSLKMYVLEHGDTSYNYKA